MEPIISPGHRFVSEWQALVSVLSSRAGNPFRGKRNVLVIIVKVVSVNPLSPESACRLVRELDTRLKKRWPERTGVLRLIQRSGQPFSLIRKTGGRYEVCVTSSVPGVLRGQLLEVIGPDWEVPKKNPARN